MEFPFLQNILTKQIYEFGDKQEFLIGRSAESEIDIRSTFISRRQCVIKKIGDNWFIVNLSNLKTTNVNNRQISEGPNLLVNGDKINFNHVRDTELVFFSSQDESCPSIAKRRRLNDDEGFASSGITQEEPQESHMFKQLVEKYQASLSESTALLEKNSGLTKSLEKFESQVKELENEKKNLLDQVVGLEVSKKSLMTECTENTSYINDLLEEMKRFNDEKNSLVTKINEMEELSNAKALEKSQNKELERDSDVGKIKVKMLEDIVCSMTAEKEKFMEQIVSTVEQELSCCVCSDVIFEAVILNCKHTLCKVCLAEWKKKKKECPECRTKIKHETRNLKMDSFLERITPLMGDAFIQKRQETIKDRCFVPSTSEVHTTSRRGRAGGRSRGRSRGTITEVLALSSALRGNSLQPMNIDLTNSSPVQPPSGSRRSVLRR